MFSQYNKPSNNYQNYQKIVSAEHGSKIIKLIYAETKILRLIPTHHHNNGNHVRLYEEKTNKKFHVKFAKEPFKRFGNFFCGGKTEAGESINLKAIQDLDKDDLIFFCRPDTIERIFVGDLMKEGLKRITESGEITMSISLFSLEKMI